MSGSTTTTGGTFSWLASNGGNIVSGATTATPTVNAAGTYTLTVTNPTNGCTTTDIVLVTLNNTIPNANAGADKELTCTTTSIALSGSTTTTGATFSWLASNGGNIVSGATTATPTVNGTGTYTLTVTNPINGCTATDIALVTLNNTVPNINAGTDKVLTCSVTSIALSGSSTTIGATFSWLASDGGNIVSGATTSAPTVNAAGTYTLTVTNPVNGCTATDIVLVTLNNTPPNVSAGNDAQILCGTVAVLLSGSSSTAGATLFWVASNGGNIVSGATTATPTVNAAGTYTLTITNPINGCTASDVVLVTNQICAFEGCTLGYWKNHSDRWCSSYSPSMLFGDVFVNAPSNLANQTLLEALNLGGGGIYNLARQGVAALLNACSDEVDFPAPYSDNTQSVINAINAAYLAGGTAPGQLASQLDILNNSGCPLGGTKATNKGSNLDVKPVGFDAYPVPFKDVLTIKYKFDYVSDVKIEVFNSLGTAVLSKTDTNSYLNKEVVLNLKMNRGQEQVYVVKVTTNQGTFTKKVMSSK